MPTVQRTFAFATDLQGLVDDVTTTASATLSWEGTDGNPAGSLKYVQGSKNQTSADTATDPAGTTWESWGVPAGTTVNSVRVVSASRKVAANTKLTAHDWAVRVVDDAGASVHGATDLLSEALPTATGAWIAAGGIAAAQTVNAASTAVARFRLAYNVSTGAGGGAASVDARFDEIVLEIDHTVAPITFAVGGGLTPAATAAFIKKAALSLSGEFVAGGGTTHADDTFTRTVTDGWGTADTGGAWTVIGTAADYDVSGTEATIALAAGANRNAAMNAVQATGNLQVQVDWGYSAAAGGSDFFGWYGFRRQETDTNVAGTLYDVRWNVSTAGAIRIQHHRFVAATGTFLGTTYTTALTFATTKRYTLKTLVEGGTTVTLSSKLWEVGTAEPTDWQKVDTDTPGNAYLEGTSAGTVTLRGQLGTSSNAGTLSYDNFSVVTPGAGGTYGLAGTVATAIGTEPVITAAGAMTPAAAISQRVDLVKAGSTTSAAVIIHAPHRMLAGTVSGAAGLTTSKTAVRGYDGGVTPAGAAAKRADKAAVASIASAGTAVHLLTKALTAALSTSATLGRSLTRTLVGTVTDAGDLVITKVAIRSFAGAVTPAGAIFNRFSAARAGSITSAATFVQQVQRALAGAVTSSSTIANIRALLRSFAGSVSSAGSATRQAQTIMAGTASSAGQLARSTQQALAGAVTSAATVTATRLASTFTVAVSGSATSAATLVQRLDRSIAGAMSSAGASIRQMAHAVTGSIASAGARGQSALRTVAGALSSAGAIATVKQTGGIVLSGSLAASGAVLRESRRSLTSAVATSGSAARQTAISFTAAISTAGAVTATRLSQTFTVALQGAVSLGSALVRSSQRTFSSSLTSSGALLRFVTARLSGVVATAGAAGTLVRYAVAKGGLVIAARLRDTVSIGHRLLSQATPQAGRRDSVEVGSAPRTSVSVGSRSGTTLVIDDE